MGVPVVASARLFSLHESEPDPVFLLVVFVGVPVVAVVGVSEKPGVVQGVPVVDLVGSSVGAICPIKSLSIHY